MNSYPHDEFTTSRARGNVMESMQEMLERVGEYRAPFPYCCRYKERGAMFCHDGHACKCDCHGREAPPVSVPHGGAS